MFSLTSYQKTANSKKQISLFASQLDRDFFYIHHIQSCDYNAAGGKLNCYKFSGGQFGIMYIEPTVLFVDLYNEEVIGQ